MKVTNNSYRDTFWIRVNQYNLNENFNTVEKAMAVANLIATTGNTKSDIRVYGYNEAGEYGTEAEWIQGIKQLRHCRAPAVKEDGRCRNCGHKTT